MKRKRRTLFYKVYDIATETLVAQGPAEECAKQLNITRNAFYSMVFRMKSNRRARFRIDIKGKYIPKNNRYIYAIENRKTKMPVINGTARECAAGLSISLRYFYDLISRTKRGLDNRYNITISRRKKSSKEELKISG